MKNVSLLNYLVALTIITIFTGVIYGTVQQLYRANANDPQVQLAHDIANDLQQKPMESILLPDTIDLTKSLGVFMVFYDAGGNTLRSSGLLDGQPAQLPKGIFDITKNHGEHRVTWQPRRGVRMAMIVVAVNNSPVAYVAVGRSLKEVEDRIGKMIWMLAIGWITCAVVLGISAGIYLFIKRAE